MTLRRLSTAEYGHLELQGLLPGCRLVMLEGGGHFPQEDAPDAVTHELNAFLTL